MNKIIWVLMLVATTASFTGCNIIDLWPRNALGVGILNSSEKLNKLSNGGLVLTEGPVWNGKDAVYFRGGPEASIYRYSIESKEVAILNPSTKGIHGLMFLASGELLACMPDKGKIVRVNTNGDIASDFVSTFDGRPFNQPNDLVTDKTGGLYFTDPSWKSEDERPHLIKGVYYVDANGTPSLVIGDMIQPNGIILSEDGSSLYVVDMHSDEFRKYPILAPGKLGSKSIFARLRREFRGRAAPDGMAVDTQGNVYVTTNTGVQVFSSKGDFQGEIQVPERSANVTFFGPQMNHLFITAEDNVYSIKLNVKGIQFPKY